jgi:DNA-binding MarR family transcriptional regulator
MPPRRARGPTPHPAAEPLHRAALQLLRLLRREDAASGLSPARLSALSVLVFAGPCTLGALAAAEGVSAPTMSRLVAELERERWIDRRADPHDARATHLEATAAARTLLLEGRARRLEALTLALRAIPAADRTSLRCAVPALERLVRALASTPSAAARAASGARGARRRFD